MINMIPRVQNETDHIFREIVKNHGSRIYNLALMKCNQVPLAEDISQETFIRVYRGLNSFRDESHIGTWIYRIALNVCHTMIKKESLLTTRTVPLEDRADLEPADLDSDVQDIFIKDVEKDQIREAISALPPLQSDAITLFYLKQFQYSEVADIMNIPLNTVKSHIRRAKANLKLLLMEVYDETR
ncbi:MAG: RNA polymerase sigma factor [Candidatus Marinimicrobia bacterium]|jgi:RNA polymerase sigma-70 factor, ECF subfamily|nr:RNA polymerase sigma factor [Candidatus Neomarinimicrobiota bacterium]MBT4359621.1 RNA polymerase sigma factor [Candidatus Neomarinimicrobiota bacterium]MBT4713811.1 RNA polymerase sigma factor [Candidatus Neomarinimicrobiota bacterium]MBT4944914.1 RNA polymerase sigma factor [Candidatus Neomarinimicrobiota bacterium]MBT5269426.1 RNA polymerase sigma factor [Candidatus Neomarinimicrobiota bacterium]